MSCCMFLLHFVAVARQQNRLKRLPLHFSRAGLGLELPLLRAVVVSPFTCRGSGHLTAAVSLSVSFSPYNQENECYFLLLLLRIEGDLWMPDKHSHEPAASRQKALQSS